MTLGTFAPQARIDSDHVRADSLVNVPLLLRVEKVIADFVTVKYPAPKDVVIVDVVNLQTGQIFIGPLWGAGAVVDALKPYVGTDQPLPVKLVMKKSAAGNDYLSVAALEGAERQVAEQWYAAYPTALKDHRAQREAQAQLVTPAQTMSFNAPANAAFNTPAPVAPIAPVAAVPAPPVAPAPAYVPSPAYDQAQAAAWTGAPVTPAPAPVVAAPVAPAPAAVPAPVAPAPAPAPVMPEGLTADQIQAAIASLNGQQPAA